MSQVKAEKNGFKLSYKVLPLIQLKENPQNPNVMDPKTFQLLVDNIKREGFKDPIIVRPRGEDGFYLIEDGHHRKMALVELGFDVGPCVIADFGGNLNLSSLMLNKIKGRLAPDKVGAILMGMREEYTSAEMAQLTGYSSQELMNYASVLKLQELPDLGQYSNLVFFHYSGGKHFIKNKIISALPPHTTFVEVFGGAGHIILNKPTQKNVIDVWNDIDSSLYNLFFVVRNHFEEFKDKAEGLIISREQFAEFKEAPEPADPIERAIRTYYLIQAGFAGFQRGSWGFSRSRNQAWTFWHGFELLEQVWRRLQFIQVDHLDFRKCIRNWDSADTVFFLDPPYYGFKFYGYNFTEKDHEDLHKLLTSGVLGKWIITYNNHPWVREKYRLHQMRLATQMLAMRKAIESTRLTYQHLVIMNYNPDEIIKNKEIV